MTKQDEQDVIELWMDGFTIPEIVGELGVSALEIIKFLDSKGL